MIDISTLRFHGVNTGTERGYVYYLDRFDIQNTLPRLHKKVSTVFFLFFICLRDKVHDINTVRNYAHTLRTMVIPTNGYIKNV